MTGPGDEKALPAPVDEDPTTDDARYGVPPSPTVRRFGRYELLEPLGMGGFGTVHRGRDPNLDREVAIKVLERFSEAARTRFAREVRLAARLRHKNIVAVHDAGEYEGRPYLVMDLVRGKTLKALAAPRGLEPSRAAALLRDIARGLHHAHEQGVLHRDLEPANVIIDEHGVPLILDFGLASLEDETGRSRSEVAGTPGYMSPEQVSGAANVTRATDVWGLGATLFHALTGRPPFVGASPAQTVQAILQEAPPRPSELVHGIPRQLEHLCLRCLEKSPSARPASAAALADELDRYLGGGRPGRISGFLLRAVVRAATPARTLPESLSWLALAVGVIALLSLGAGTVAIIGPGSAVAPPASLPAEEARRARAAEHARHAAELLRRGDLQGAQDQAGLAIAADAGLVDGWLLRGEARLRAHDPGGALADATQALELDRGLGVAWSNRAAAHLALDRPHEALADATRAIELAPELAPAWANRAGARVGLFDIPGAVPDYDQALKLDPGVAQVWADRAFARWLQKDPQGAFGDAERAIGLDAGCAFAWAIRGFVRADRGERPGAVADLERALGVGTLPPDLAETVRRWVDGLKSGPR